MTVAHRLFANFVDTFTALMWGNYESLEKNFYNPRSTYIDVKVTSTVVVPWEANVLSPRNFGVSLSFSQNSKSPIFNFK